MKKIISLLVFAIAFTSVSIGQIQVTNTQTVADLIQNVLIGTGVTATNITVNGSAATAMTVQANASYFNQNGTAFTIPEGVLLSTGAGTVAVGPNGSGSQSNPAGTVVINDPDLNAVAAGNITNGIFIEFDFVATGNRLEFDYIFASEEYPEFSPSTFNDAFGFFLSGPGINGPYTNNAENIAIIPNTTTPVTINNVNPTTNPAYYVDNVGGANYGNAIQYDGTTVVLTAESDLICDSTYHIKLAIGNVSDQGWDSGVFLEAGSFQVNPIAFSFNTAQIGNVVYEDCQQLGTIQYTRDGCGISNDTLVAYVSFTGTGVNGVDYQQLGDSVVMFPGTDTIYWQIIPITDGLTEGIEDVIVTVSVVTQSGDTLTGQGTFYISDPLVPSTDATDTTLNCIGNTANIFANATDGVPPYTYDWSNGSTASQFSVTSTANGIVNYYLELTDACGTVVLDTATLNVQQTLNIDDILTGPATCDPTGYVSAQITEDNTYSDSYIIGDFDNPQYTWYGPNSTTNQLPQNASVVSNISGGWYYLTVEHHDCIVTDSAFVQTENLPQAGVAASPLSECNSLTTTLTNSSTNSDTYFWDFGNGNTLNTTSNAAQSQSYGQSATIMLVAGIASNPNCNDTAYVNVTVITCGCMDPEALNYNPNAVSDDGSCTYPLPEVTAPNVINLNGGDNNGFYYLTTKHAQSVELIILNRWGGVLFEKTGTQDFPPIWDGTDASGKKVTEGTYFYRYKVTGEKGDVLEGHGFIEVLE